MIGRIVEPEILDELPAADARAVGSRRDLQRLNRLMGHARLIARALRATAPPRRVLDLGAGDGTLMLAVTRAARWQGTEIILLDRADSVASEIHEGFASMGCRLCLVQRDVLRGLDEIGSVDCITANLFLHHFRCEDLRGLLARAAANCRTFVACEPRRGVWPLFASRLIGAIGCNAVTRHDAVASVRAGFRDQEISALWPKHSNWSLREGAAGLFSHMFVALKNRGFQG